MKYEAWIWGTVMISILTLSTTGMLSPIPEVLIALPAALFALGASAFFIGDNAGENSARTRRRFLSCTLAALTAVLAGFHLPLRAGFLISRSKLEHLADKVRSGDIEEYPQRASIYQIRGSETDAAGAVCLWVISWEGMRAGFARTVSDESMFPAKEIRLTDGWRYVVRRGSRSADGAGEPAL